MKTKMPKTASSGMLTKISKAWTGARWQKYPQFFLKSKVKLWYRVKIKDVNVQKQ